jgi:catechol-2,3-dioxygenase
MLHDSQAYGGFSVDDIGKAKEFYKNTLGLEVTEEERGILLTLGSGARILVYPKENHTPAHFTVLNFPVDNVDQTIDELAAKGVKAQHYTSPQTDEKGILRGLATNHGRDDVAWITDPAGNVIAVYTRR